MADKKEKPVEKPKEEEDSDLEPCTKPYTAETSRPDEGDEACDDGVR